MKVTRILLALLFASCAWSVKLEAQTMPKSFTEDNVKFIEEMRDFFESNEKKEGRDFIDDFNEQYWLTGKVSEEIKQAMYKNTNAMAKKKFKPSPEYYAYFNTIKSIVDKKIPMTTFNDWQVCFMSVSNNKNQRPFSDFIMMGEDLFRDNTFYDTPSGSWQALGGTWKFMCDTIPQIRFTNVTLKGTGKNDSTLIYNTTGTYNVSKQTWVGKGGKVDWKRAGLKETEVYAELNNYNITMKSMSYVADTVTFYNKIYFKEKPLIGKLTEKLTPDVTIASANYPRFESYSSRYQIKSMYPNVDYEGGFSQIGFKFIGSGSKEAPAFFLFKRNGKDFLYASSQSFSITDDKVTSPNTSIKFFLDKDSIVHPLVDFKYFVDSSKVMLYRSNEGASQAPYYNSFHQVDMYVEQIVWKTNEPTITMGTLPGTTQGEAKFPSSDYYRQYLYDRLQGMEMVHPLIKIRNFVRDENGGITTFPLASLAKYWKLPIEQLRPTIMNLSNEGFLIYDPITDMVTYKDKCDTYIAARAGKKDYDNILFESKVAPGTPNAKLNLLNYDMTIFGVQEIAMSDSQNVVVFPAEDKIILKKNRNFTFEGSIMAGRFDYYGKLFSFDYATFKMNLSNVDSVRIWVDTPERDPRDPKGGFKQVKVRSVIENLNGELRIDNPANKSGVWSKKYANYPIFTSAKPAYVYYDKPAIHKGVYNRDKFYFKLDTFTIDSLDNFQNNALHFSGIFQSAGIFPEIRDTLSLQPDYSLGFVRQAPPGGYPLYGGKAKFTNTMSLSNKGLHGNGQIDYITSTSISKDFTFFPDSANGLAETFDMKEQKVQGKTEYPEVTGKKVYIHWMPKKDFMEATNTDSAFTVFGGEATVSGTLTLGPKNLLANGKMNFSNAEMVSKKMVLKHHVVDADTADFSLKALEMAGLAFSTNNVNAHVDFEKRQGDFKANGEGSIVTFPVNQYICYMENFKWYMDKEEIELNGAKPKPGDQIALEGPEFISIHPKQDSLRFRAPKAIFDMKNYIIYAKEVKEVLVADAKILPDSGYVTIERNAYMRPMDNAKIDANTVTEYHHLFNAHVEVFSRRSYTASGDYAYVDELKKEQLIHFSKVAPDTSGQTYAEGFIADTAKFALSPAFDFQGKVILAANNQFLVFDGTAGLQHDCAIGKERLRFTGEINPTQIYIPVAPNLTDEKGTPITAGIISTVDSFHVYGAFLSPRKYRTDVTVVGADGFMFFDKASREYRISNKEKLVERSLPGNYISFSTKNCTVYGEGKMNLGSDLGQVTMMPIGNATHNTITQTTDFDLVIAIDFYMSEKAMDVLIEDINASTSLAGTEATRPTFERALNEIVGQKKADKLISDLKLYGSYKKFPDELKYTFFFTDVKMVWNQKTRSYISTGKLGLGSIGNTQINKFVPGVIMLKRNKGVGTDILSIYLELDNSKWYTFRYTSGTMLTYSSNTKFNDIIKEIKDDDKKKDGEKGQRNYRYTLGSPGERSLIVKAQKQAEESGGSEPEDPEPK
ncbi:MAG TPA: hypothetical protein VK826_07095 [Bacteroidia bacterium]|nr:hypothetical protein [Bacteroidia bacterium]